MTSKISPNIIIMTIHPLAFNSLSLKKPNPERHGHQFLANCYVVIIFIMNILCPEKQGFFFKHPSRDKHNDDQINRR